MIEERGTPATVVITEPFQTVVASNAVKLGAPGYHATVVPHPVYGKSASELQSLAQGLAHTVIGQLVGAAPETVA